MCLLLRVPRSSFYAWRQHVVSTQTLRREHVSALAFEVFHEFREVYGCRRITRELNKRGIACSVGFIASVMKEMGLVTVQPRAYKVTTVRGEGDIYPSDVIARDFTSSIPGTRLVGDITYLRTGEGWLYLATVIDLATSMVVGWCTDNNMRTPLIEKALEMARLHGHVKPHAVFHSDRGSQYASSSFSKYCTSIDVTQSMGKTGVFWDNSVAESFFATLKNEMYYRYRFTSRARARFAVAEYIEVFYNRKRAHSSIGYLTPSEKLQEFQATPMAA